MDFENLRYKTINDVSEWIEAGQICPEELTHFYIENIK